MKKDSMSRHAYCILVHNEPSIFKTLVSLIDDPKNDIFVHVDKKADISLFQVQLKFSNIIYSERYRIFWGDYSLINATINLLNLAFNYGTYSYFHILSGVDLPLKSQEYIHKFCDELYPGKEFIGIADEKQDEWIKYRSGYYHFFGSTFRCKDTKFSRAKKWVSSKLISIQFRLRLKRNNEGLDFKMGPNWCSLSNHFIEYLLQKRKWIEKRFRYNYCSDEIFIQTILWNSPFKANIYKINDHYMSCMRKIGWDRGKPYTWQSTDYEELVNCPHLFARKFSSADLEIVTKIKRHLQSIDDLKQK